MLKRRLFVFISFVMTLMLSHSVSAMLSLELTRGISGALPIAIVPFTGEGSASQVVSEIISNDLANSGRFKVVADQKSADNIVTGKVVELGANRYQVSFQLKDGFKTNSDNAVLLNKQFTGSDSELRALAHHISDLVYQQLTGIRGVFSTRLAYVVVQQKGKGQSRYILEVSDQDGYNPKPLLASSDPIMSPSWSPDGRQVAYVSFENKHASIYVQNVSSGSRHLVSQFPGINGAPAWSPDSRKLALVLSKSGSPNIYVLDLATRQLTQLTKDYYINTEPSWSPNGSSIVFTSNRSGNPQVYEMNVATKTVNRITYDGNYNARPSYTPDGNHLVVLHRASGMYEIGIMDLGSGSFRVLTNSSLDHGSPSIAPNSSMVVFEAYDTGKNVLGMVTTDGSIHMRLPARNGDAQDPAWSPFLS